MVKKKRTGLFIVIAIISILFILASLFFRLVTFPAYLSVVSVCAPEDIAEEQTTDKGFVLAGQFTAGGGVDPEIKIFVPSPQVAKHENCHQTQFEEGRLNSCVLIVNKYIDEVECYIAQRLPDSTYIIRYGVPPNVTSP